MSVLFGSMTRREWLTITPAAAAFLTVHELLGLEPIPTSQPATVKAPGLAPRIQALRLLTAVPLVEMREFYHNKIGFRVIEQSETKISFAAGATRLTFEKARPDQIRGTGGRGDGGPMYHFAFNIPQDKLLAARAWQLERTKLIDPRPDIRDESLPSDVWHFRHWNAHSLFFWDPAFNIVELIARHTLPCKSAKPDRFSVTDIQCASEIGFVVDSATQQAATRLLRDKLGLHEYPRGADPWAMGDEHGLLLCLARKGQTWGEHTPTSVRWDVFPTEATVAGPADGHFAFDGFPYRVQVEK